MANFTNNEKFLMEIILNLPGKPDTDWNKVMTAMGMQSLGGTKNKLRLLEKSYNDAKAAQAAGNVSAPPAAPKKSSKRQAADTEGTEGTSKKKAKNAKETTTEA